MAALHSGRELEAYFRDLLTETQPIELIGSWWETSCGKSGDTDQNEIDIVAIYFKEKRVLMAEVKRQRKSFDQKRFLDKVESLKNKLFARYKIDTMCLTLDDM